MKTVSLQRPQLVCFTLLAITIGLLWLMHVTSGPEVRCASETVDMRLLKLI